MLVTINQITRFSIIYQIRKPILPSQREKEKVKEEIKKCQISVPFLRSLENRKLFFFLYSLLQISDWKGR